MDIFNFIIWSVNPEIFPSFDKLPVRWYGLLFAMAFIVGQQILYYIYKKEGRTLPPPTNKSYSGKFVLRTGPDLHKALAIKAMSEGDSLNNFVVKKLKRIVIS